MDYDYNAYQTYQPDLETQEEADLDLPRLAQAKGPETHFASLTDIQWSLYVSDLIGRYGHAPIKVIGLLANIVVLWVWSAESTYHTTTYLFKVLAITDSVSLSSSLIYEVVIGKFLRGEILYVLIHGLRKVAVQITMLLAVARVITVFFPLRSERLLSRFRLNIVLAGFILWTLGAQMTENYFRSSGRMSELLMFNTYVTVPFCVMIPSALQVILMTVVTWKVWRSSRVVSSSNRPVVSFQQDKHTARRMVYTVFTMCIFTFIAYFVGTCIKTFVESRPPGDKLIYPFRQIIYTSDGLLIVINSSVNVLLYYFFIGRFKVLFMKKLRGSQHSFNFKSPSFYSASGPSLPEGVTMTTDPDQYNVIIREEAGGDATKSIMPACSFEKTEDETEIQSSAAPTGLKEDSGSVNTYIT